MKKVAAREKAPSYIVFSCRANPPIHSFSGGEPLRRLLTGYHQYSFISDYAVFSILAITRLFYLPYSPPPYAHTPLSSEYMGLRRLPHAGYYPATCMKH